jgi:hypothetical protein
MAGFRRPRDFYDQKNARRPLRGGWILLRQCVLRSENPKETGADIALLLSEAPCTSAATFTTNLVKAAPCRSQWNISGREIFAASSSTAEMPTRALAGRVSPMRDSWPQRSGAHRADARADPGVFDGPHRCSTARSTYRSGDCAHSLVAPREPELRPSDHDQRYFSEGSVCRTGN